MATARWRQWGQGAKALLLGAATALLVACGGGGGGDTPPAPPPPPPVDARLAWGDAGFQTILNAVPTAGGGGGGGGTSTTLTIHYQRPLGDYTGWTLHTWDAAVETTWAAGLTPIGTDSFGQIYQVPLRVNSGNVGYLFHQGDTKDHGGADQAYTLQPGVNTIWRIAGDNTTYRSNPGTAAAPDLRTLRVHYRRFGGDHANWGLHLWPGSGLDPARLPAGLAIDQWGSPVAFSAMPGYAATGDEVVFDIPVLNPRDDAARTALQFIIHGMPPRVDDKDGRPDNIRIDYRALDVSAQVGKVWLVQGDPTLYLAPPDTRSASTRDMRAVWLNRSLLQWPRVSGTGVVKLYHSATGQVQAARDGRVSGADGSITLQPHTGSVPAAVAERFRWVEAGAVFAVPAADQAQLPALLKSQLVLVQEDAAGLVQNATTAQVAGALDDLYAAAADVADLGVGIGGGNTRFKLWAPTAQKVHLYTYESPTAAASTVDEMTWDAATGVWSATRSGNLQGRYYRYAVDVFARGTGLVRNLVTDPYSVSLSANSARSYVADLSSAALKPAGWDASAIPARVQASTDLVVYELHVRDFSAGDSTVSAAQRGKYGAFAEADSNGMKHLKAIAQAGVTDVHLLPVFDLATVPETGCTTPSPSGAADSDSQQATVGATVDADCYNWGYDPWHYNAPEGSYATDAADGARRVIEFRQMVMGLHAAGLRVGMDVVYNHTTASGQNAKSVLDRVVPGYYHRYNADGSVANSTCCDNTATENRMMAKLMIDSAVLWARDYKIASFRFDIMGHQPRAAMEQLQAQVNAATGRSVQLIGEGWNFGEVANDARFVQARQGGLGGTGIGSFGDKMRDAVRGGGCCDSGSALVSQQGFVNGLYHDPNPQGTGKSLNDLRWVGDLIKAGLAGSIHDYTLLTHWDATVALKDLDGAGFATEPGEVVNYVENHDNLTLFDVNAMKLPVGTSKADRARAQVLGLATVAFSQGTAYFHAGMDILRSKSGDRNSYDSGDWFNRLDWTYTDNHFGTGLPRQPANGADWALLRPFLANADIKPGPGDIAYTRDAFRDLLKIRASTTLLRLRTAQDIRERLRFLNTGSSQVPTVLVGHVNGQAGSGLYPGAVFKEIVYFINVDQNPQTLTLDALKGRTWIVHPTHIGGADRRPALEGAANGSTGVFTVPARTAMAFVVL